MKKHNKIISIVLALALVFSCVGPSFAAAAKESYTPTYDEMVTEKDVVALLDDVNTILNENLLTGSTIESIYKLLPGLKALLVLDGSASDKGSFYKKTQSERFADLTDGQLESDTYDEDGKLVSEGTLTAFFKKNPIVCKDASDFKKELDIVVKTVLVPNIFDTLQFLPVMTGDFTSAPALGDGIDEICKAIGIKQENKAADVLGFNLFTAEKPYDIAATNAYIQNITAALFPDTANSVIDLLQTVLKPENSKLLYSGLTKVVNNLAAIVKGLEPTLTQFGININDVLTAIADIKDTFAALPTTGEGDNIQLDIQGTVGYLIKNLTGNAVGIKFANGPAQNSTIVLEFTDMKLERFTDAESNADAVKIIYDYLYQNIIGNNQTNSLLKIGLSTGIIENALGITLPEDTKEFIQSALKMSNSELANELIIMVANLAGREIKKTGNTNAPDKPVNPEKPEDKNEDSKKPIIKPGLKPSDSSNSRTDTDASGRKIVKKANIPNTGAPSFN